MDKVRAKTRTARNRLAEATSSGTGQGSLHVPHSSLAPHDNSSTHAVNEGFLGPLPGTEAQDFATPNEPTRQPVIEPPTSLQSSVDAVRVREGQEAARHHTKRLHLSSNINAAHLWDDKQVAQGPNPSAQRLSTLPALDEEHALGQVPSNSSKPESTKVEPTRLRKVKSAIQTRIPFWGSPEKQATPDASGHATPQYEEPADYTSDMVDVLDTIDPEVATLTSLTNVQNSLFIPNLPFLNRRPTYNLRRRPSETESLNEINRVLGPLRDAQAEEQAVPRLRRTESEGTMATVATIDSQLSDSRYAVLPQGASLEGWSKQDKAEVNDHVRHMLHSKRSKFKRTMRGFGQYVRRPLGFAVTLYATLITLFGLAWVLFLIGWINVGGRQIYVVHVIDSVLVALFAVVGDGLAPFRAIDTYHMIYIAHYHHYTWSRRKKDMLPALTDNNDLPSANAPISVPRTVDPEDPEKQWEFTVLTPKQQEKLEHHQAKFCKSHSFYKPHETETHHAFPLRFLVAIVVLLDCHSLLQISLGACTWGIYYKVRPFALTTVILCCSITCNATAGLLIWLGDKRTRKNDVVERMNRQELTEEAIRHVEKKKEKGNESEEEGEKKRSGSRMSFDGIRKFQAQALGGDKKGKAEQKEEPACP
ncbi:hypothetical protein SNOG_12039 [Parastagonospora nodorum SN15]|uniref:Integral membrane protein n=1 Tax=Phaeosphaeria nodorum (strain SN15 / ATCC MYA-4574 / FGSC 10173) TaxID=321614 RepID=Q0U875_PHANO|nr:hypothetical protein SNOG_12039 [Parastagonospora nodorum SN15]EAT80451.2 hypothetical protein SNOG_12039 [Parastagonospora nodorum SN15]